jgi:FkbM family methyltransferase
VSPTEQETRKSFFEQAGRHTPFVAVKTRDGLSFIVSTEDTSVGKSLFMRRTRSEFRMLASAMKALRRIGVPRRGIFVDVGANIGTTTVAALAHHGFPTAVAYEPDPLNSALLRANLALNGLESRARVVEAVVSDAPGSVHLTGSEKHGGHKVSSAGWPVDAVALDDEIHEDIGLIWIDVQGHEGHVFLGAERLLHSRPPVVVEVSPGHLKTDGTYDGFLKAAQAYKRFLIPGKRPASHPISKLEATLGAQGQGHVDVLLIP